MTDNDPNFITVQLVCKKYKRRKKKIYSINYFVDNKNRKQEVTEQKLFAALIKFQFTTFAANAFLFKSVKVMVICGGTVGGEGLYRCSL